MAEIRLVSDKEDVKSGLHEPVVSGGPDIVAAIKRCAIQDLKQCRYSREEIALEISSQIGRKVTIAQIDAMVAESKPHRFPLELLPTWVRVTGSRKLLDLVCSAAGFQVTDETESGLAEFGRTVLQRERIAVQEERLRARLQETLR